MSQANQSGTNIYVIGCTAVAALGGLLFGFDTAVINGAEKTLAEVFQVEGIAHGFTVASALVGTIVGAVGVGYPADRFGRRLTLTLIAMLYIISAIGSALAWDWWSFVTFRLIGGLGVGGASVVSPMYIAEIAPARMRGRLVAVTQFNIVLGILVAFFSNYVIAGLDLGDAQWRWMFGVEAAPAALFLILLAFVPRSPRWLMKQGLTDEAKRVIELIGSDTGDADSEIAEIQHSLHKERQAAQESLFQKKYLTPILLAVAIAAFNQLSGINAVMYYAKRIFEAAGAGEESALLQTVAIGGTNLVFTMIAMTLIDNFGRRKLMIVGSLGYIVSLSAVAWAFYSSSPGETGQEFTPAGSMTVLVGLMVFIASHAFGQGAVIWVFISEIFPNQVRARGQALGSFTHWFFAAAISWTFPVIAEQSGGHAFAFYAVCCVLQLVWVLLVMPETKGIPLEQMEAKLGIRQDDESTL